MTALLVSELNMEMVEGEKWDVINQKLTLEPAFGIRVNVTRNPEKQGSPVNATPLDEEVKEG